MERGRKGLVGGGFGWRRIGVVMEVVRRKLGVFGWACFAESRPHCNATIRGLPFCFAIFRALKMPPFLLSSCVIFTNSVQYYFDK